MISGERQNFDQHFRSHKIGYNPAEMMKKRFVALAFTTHALLGSFCMMPMAMAAPTDMPMAHEENMTPMDAMSHQDCDRCPHQEQGAHPSQSGCAGHCLTAASDNTAYSNPNSTQQTLSVVISPPIPVVFAPVEVAVSGDEVSKPPEETGTRTVVLRQ